MAAIPMSFVIGSPIAGWILGHKWFAVEGWRWLFVLEGMPAILLGAVAFFLLTDWPGEATWLAPEQRQWIAQELHAEKHISAQAFTVAQALKSRIILLLAGLTFLNYLVFCSFAFWFPTMLKRQSGFSDVRVGLLGAMPYVATFIAMQINGWHSDKNCERRWHSAVPMFVSAIGLLGLLGQPRSIPVSIVLFTMVCMAFAYLPDVLGDPDRDPEPVGRSGRSGHGQRCGQRSRLCRPSSVWLPEHSNGIIFVRLALMMVSALAGGLLMLCIPRSTRALVC